jgi:hypothetical protein
MLFTLLGGACRLPITNDMKMLVSNEYPNQLFLIEIIDNSIIKSQKIFDLNQKNGEMIIKAGFVEDEQAYILYRSNTMQGQKYSIIVYDIHSKISREVRLYENDWDGIKLIAVDQLEGFYCFRLKENVIMQVDFHTNEIQVFFTFTEDMKITGINSVSRHVLVINATDGKTDKYYYIDKTSGSILSEGEGYLYANKQETNFSVLESGGKLYLFNTITHASKEIIVPVNSEYRFFYATPLNSGDYILCFLSETTDNVINFFFGQGHTKRTYQYWYVEMSDNLEGDCQYKQMRSNFFNNKFLFDARSMNKNLANR